MSLKHYACQKKGAAIAGGHCSSNVRGLEAPSETATAVSSIARLSIPVAAVRTHRAAKLHEKAAL